MAKRVLTLIDEANIASSAHEAGLSEVDWRSLTAFLVNREPDRESLDTVVYVGLPPMIEEFAELRAAKERFVHKLRLQGFAVVTNEGAPTEPGKWSANVDVLMALDAMDLAFTARPDVIVLATGDSDFATLAKRLRHHGIRVEIASAGGSLGRRLAESANVVIDLTPLFKAVVEGRKRPPRQLAGFAMGNGRSAASAPAEPPRRE